MPEKVKRKDALTNSESKILSKTAPEKLKGNPRADLTELTKSLLEEHGIHQEKLKSA